MFDCFVEDEWAATLIDAASVVVRKLVVDFRGENYCVVLREDGEYQKFKMAKRTPAKARTIDFLALGEPGKKKSVAPPNHPVQGQTAGGGAVDPDGGDDSNSEEEDGIEKNPCPVVRNKDLRITTKFSHAVIAEMQQCAFNAAYDKKAMATNCLIDSGGEQRAATNKHIASPRECEQCSSTQQQNKKATHKQNNECIHTLWTS